MCFSYLPTLAPPAVLPILWGGLACFAGSLPQAAINAIAATSAPSAAHRATRLLEAFITILSLLALRVLRRRHHRQLCGALGDPLVVDALADAAQIVLVCFDRFFVERFSLFFEQDVVLLQFQCREFLRAFGVEQRAAEALINRTEIGRAHV